MVPEKLMKELDVKIYGDPVDFIRQIFIDQVAHHIAPYNAFTKG